MALEVLLEGCGPTFIAKGNVRFQSPGTILRSMRRPSGVVILDSCAQIIRQTNIVAVWLGDTFQYVDVFHAFPRESVPEFDLQ
jgi:hypothetical protein